MKPSMMSRLAVLEAMEPPGPWERIQGLAALLAYARKLPPRDPWELTEVEANTGMGRLLREARRALGREEE